MTGLPPTEHWVPVGTISDVEAPERIGLQTHRILRDRIVTGVIAPGSRLSVPALARELGVSRSPVRDAVLRLVREGLAEEVYNRGAVVRLPGPARLVSLYEVREPLEGMAARLAAGRVDPEAVDRLRGLLRRHTEVAAGEDFRSHIELDAAFHATIRELARNPVLERLLDEIQGQVMVAMRSTSATGGMRQAVREHRAIVDALATGDPEASEVAARSHIARLTGRLRDGMDR
ncbi:MAG: GntR family transcriptional regulator [Propionibacteriaceae bacterium]